MKAPAKKIIALVVGALVVILAVSLAAASGGGGGSTTPTSKPPAATAPHKPAAPKPKAEQKVTFKVWGDAPAGALGPVTVTYGSDTENLQGKVIPFTETLPYDSSAAYYDVSAQLQGHGDIHCSVTVNGHTKTAHASGGYNICQAELTPFDW